MTTTKCELFKVFSNDTRFSIFKMLLKEKLCVSKIVEKVKVSQPTVTQHLKLLQYCGLVKSEKVVCWMHYSADLEGIKKCRKELVELLDTLDSAEAKKEADE
ncbi:MAG: ArsR/SmtB family transcription factor [Elusimicrobiota bacterium]